MLFPWYMLTHVSLVCTVYSGHDPDRQILPPGAGSLVHGMSRPLIAMSWSKDRLLAAAID